MVNLELLHDLGQNQDHVLAQGHNPKPDLIGQAPSPAVVRAVTILQNLKEIKYKKMMYYVLQFMFISKIKDNKFKYHLFFYNHDIIHNQLGIRKLF